MEQPKQKILFLPFDDLQLKCRNVLFKNPVKEKLTAFSEQLTVDRISSTLIAVSY